MGVKDLGKPARVCAMCESVTIRYVHAMKHPDHPETLAVGRVCAEHMETDYDAPRQREERLRMISRRRISWPKKQRIFGVRPRIVAWLQRAKLKAIER